MWQLKANNNWHNHNSYNNLKPSEMIFLKKKIKYEILTKCFNYNRKIQSINLILSSKFDIIREKYRIIFRGKS